MRSREGLETKLLDCLASLDKDPEDYGPIFQARNLLDDIEERLPPKIGVRGGTDPYQNLRDWLSSWQIGLDLLESEVEQAVREEIKPKRRSVRRTRRIARALDERDEGPPCFGFEGKTEFLVWAAERIDRSETTVRNTLGEDGTGCLVKGKQGLTHTEKLRKTLLGVLEYLPEGR